MSSTEDVWQGYVTAEGVHLPNPAAKELYNNGFYGQPRDDGLVLSPEEAVHLLERGKVEVTWDKERSQVCTTADLVDHFEDANPGFWGWYQVYKDLRTRGYVVRPGFGEKSPYRRYPRGARPNKSQSDTFVLPFLEGTFLELHELDRIVQQAVANRKTLVLGMVDASGDVTYYRSSEVRLPPNSEKYVFPDEVVDNPPSGPMVRDSEDDS